MPTPDEGVREIQLSGKQLVFLFMAVTVVSVVIFLCGVLVGRGVQAQPSRVEAPAPTDAADAPTGVPIDPATLDAPTPPPESTFDERLNADKPVVDRLAPAGARPTPTPAAPTPTKTTPPAPVAAPKQPTPAATPAATADTAKPSPGIPSEPRGNGFAIQVAALKGRAEAESVVRRLTGKGYSAYLMPPVTGQQAAFRVRVGKFADRAAAEKVATRLEREEQFKPWITR